ncbi:ATP-grasp domain-containing protein [Asticcacaulis sp.]|uniref:ATP-grasp domain-containing protein n=1 Tax=Asticcacaulis sp. TaxID=1872648 RepID=UPI003F7B5C5A
MSKRILILTPNPDHPSHHGRWPYVLDAYREALSGIDAEIFDQPWSEPIAEDYDLILPLVAWGYHNAPNSFIGAMTAMGAAERRVFNPPEIVSWNVDKRYLRDLAEAGVRIIPTLFTESVTDEDVARARADFGQKALVLKPAISAGAKNTLIWEGDILPCAAGEGDHEVVEGAITTTTPPIGPAMIQPFMPAIQSEGEWSLLYFVGQLSHAVLKTPKSGDFRSQPDYDAHLRVLTPPPEALALAQSAIDFIGRDRLLYARVDMVRAPDGGFCLMELELIEPDLYLTYHPEASRRFKDAVEAAMMVCGCTSSDHVH